jgi:hypothetical protein
MKLEDEFLIKAAQDLSDDIDFELMTKILCQSGWIKVTLNPMIMEQSQEVDEWISKCNGTVRTRGLVFVFEEPKDAEWFILRWA